jgi:hypothetical protein
MKLQNYQAEKKIGNIKMDIQDLAPTMTCLLSSILLSCSIGCSYLRFHFIHHMHKAKTLGEEN